MKKREKETETPMKHEKFTYKSLDEIRAKAKELQIHLPFADDTRALRQEASFGNVTLKNRLGVAPMEGADALPDGSPSELTLRRYVRDAEGGSAMIWFEAISIVPEGRSSAHQLMLTGENLDNYKKFTAAIKEAGMKANGFAPYLIMQANHSGRYSNPQGKPAPIIAYRHPEYEKLRAADDSCIVTDDYLKGLEEKFGEAALLAKEAGFDAVGIPMEQYDKAHFYPEKSMMTIEVVVDKTTRRLLGVQGFCADGIALKARIDAVAAMLQFSKPTLNDLSNLEVAYAPPFAAALTKHRGPTARPMKEMR